MEIEGFEDLIEEVAMDVYDDIYPGGFDQAFGIVGQAGDFNQLREGPGGLDDDDVVIELCGLAGDFNQQKPGVDHSTTTPELFADQRTVPGCLHDDRRC